jgi:hypothetical protein
MSSPSAGNAPNRVKPIDLSVSDAISRPFVNGVETEESELAADAVAQWLALQRFQRGNDHIGQWVR